LRRSGPASHCGAGSSGISPSHCAPARGLANRVIREVGPISPDAPAFPHAATGLGPLPAEKLGKVDFTNLWAGQAIWLGRVMPAAELTRALAGAALARLSRMAG